MGGPVFTEPVEGIDDGIKRYAVRGLSKRGGYGVIGRSVGYGYSNSKIGVLGESDSGVGVEGFSSSGVGMWGSSYSGLAVIGISYTGAAVMGNSNSNFGVRGGSLDSSAFFTVLNASAPVAADNLSSSTGATTTATTGPSVRTGAIPYFVSNPTCQVEQLSHDLSCNIKITGIENIDKIRPFLHADLTTSCINPTGNTPPDKVRTTPLIGDSKSILAVVKVNCPPSMTPSFVYKNVELQVGDILLSIPRTFSSK
jgi:hypothetical protein